MAEVSLIGEVGLVAVLVLPLWAAATALRRGAAWRSAPPDAAARWQTLEAECHALTEARRGQQDAARSPETQPEFLEQLLESDTELVLANPALSLILLAVPDFWSRLSPQAMRAVARSPQCPESFVAWGLRSPEALRLGNVPALLARNRHLTAERRRAALLASRFVEPRLVAALLPPEEARLVEKAAQAAEQDTATLSPEELESLCRLGRLGAGLVVEQPNCPLALLEQFSSDLGVMGRLARSPELPAARLAALVAAAAPHVRRCAAASPRLTADQFEALARDPDSGVRFFLAANPTLPLATQDVLAGDSAADVRDTLAGRGDLTASTIDKLAADPDEGVMWSVGQNPALSAADVERLCQLPHVALRCGLARNVHLSRAWQRALALDPHPDVRAVMAHREDRDWRLRVWLVQGWLRSR